MNPDIKRLYRSKENRIMLGILGGLGDYFNMDPVLLRVIFILLMSATGFLPLTLGYFIAYFVMPLKP